jgi:hypothetical protein
VEEVGFEFHAVVSIGFLFCSVTTWYGVVVLGVERVGQWGIHSQRFLPKRREKDIE